MSLANNDFNWRLVAAEDIDENQCVVINGAGKAAVADGTAGVQGIVPQAILSGERAPVIRGGTIGGLVGFSAGAQLRCQGDGTLGTGGSHPILAVVKSEDASTAVILSANLDIVNAP
jgi:hypothetical protein